MEEQERFSRQSFLGKNSQNILEACMVGVVGLGGGGSHIVQQLAHLGFRNYTLYDPDVVELSNLNRLIGGTKSDADASLLKTEVAKRQILGLEPTASIETYNCRWQINPLPLRKCDIVFGCVDGLAERRDMEATTRRYLIPYIDIGLDVHTVEGQPPIMAGQVVLSMPGGPCLHCLKFLTKENLAQEGTRYGDAGFRPQVVWANGILASTAVGMALDLLTGWSGKESPVYLSYLSNSGEVKPDYRLEYIPDVCPHYLLSQIGDPKPITF